MWLGFSITDRTSRQFVRVNPNPDPATYAVGWYVDFRQPDGTVQQWLWAQPYASRAEAIQAYVDRESSGKFAALWNGQWITPALLPAQALPAVFVAQGIGPHCSCSRH